MNDKTVIEGSLATGKQEGHETKQDTDNPKPIPSTGISRVYVGDSQPDSKD